MGKVRAKQTNSGDAKREKVLIYLFIIIVHSLTRHSLCAYYYTEMLPFLDRYLFNSLQFCVTNFCN